MGHSQNQCLDTYSHVMGLVSSDRRDAETEIRKARQVISKEKRAA